MTITYHVGYVYYLVIPKLAILLKVYVTGNKKSHFENLFFLDVSLSTHIMPSIPFNPLLPLHTHL